MSFYKAFIKLIHSRKTIFSGKVMIIFRIVIVGGARFCDRRIHKPSLTLISYLSTLLLSLWREVCNSVRKTPQLHSTQFYPVSLNDGP